MRSCIAALLLVLSFPIVARAEEPLRDTGEEQALREEIAARYSKLAGEAMPQDELAKAVTEALRLRAQVAKDVAERYAEAAKKKKGSLLDGRIVLQVRTGSGEGRSSRVDMTGGTKDVSRKVDAPIPWRAAVESDEPSQAFIQGGVIPPGKIFVVTKVKVRGTAKGDATGHGELAVRVGGEVIVDARDVPDLLEKTWEGRIVVASGQEASVNAEVARSSVVEVEIAGALEDAPPGDTVEKEKPRFDPRIGVSVRSMNGKVVVLQKDKVLWEGQGSSVATRTMSDGTQSLLVIVVDGKEVARFTSK